MSKASFVKPTLTAIRLPAVLKARLRHQAKQSGLSMNALILLAVTKASEAWDEF
jgi:hypothetical protein